MTNPPTQPPHQQCRDIEVWAEYDWRCAYEDYCDNAEGTSMTFEQFKDNHEPGEE
jgi:hypothetical protein